MEEVLWSELDFFKVSFDASVFSDSSLPLALPSSEPDCFERSSSNGSDSFEISFDGSVFSDFSLPLVVPWSDPDCFESSSSDGLVSLDSYESTKSNDDNFIKKHRLFFTKRQKLLTFSFKFWRLAAPASVLRSTLKYFTLLSMTVRLKPFSSMDFPTGMAFIAKVLIADGFLDSDIVILSLIALVLIPDGFDWDSVIVILSRRINFSKWLLISRNFSENCKLIFFFNVNILFSRKKLRRWDFRWQNSVEIFFFKFYRVFFDLFVSILDKKFQKMPKTMHFVIKEAV